MDEGELNRPNGFQPNEFQEINRSSHSNSTSGSAAQQRPNGKTSVDLNQEYHVESQPDLLMDKLRTHYRDGSTAGSKSKVFARVLFQFQAWTFIYMVFGYLSPFALEDFGEITQVCLNIFFCYIFIMIQTNWLYSILSDSDLPQIHDLPRQSYEIEGLMQNKLDISGQGTVTLPRIDTNGLIWKYCQQCERFRAPRAYHCKFCRKCILRRDHHCHLVGKCIGHYNQRYFVVVCFYTMLASAIGFPITVSYLSTLPDTTSWTEFILPYTFLLLIFRYVSWQLVMLTFNAYMMFVFGILSLLYWLSQLSIISMGKTLVEVVKQMDMKVTSPISENFRIVFGDYWILSFLLPIPNLMKQTHNGINYRNVKIFGKMTEKV